MLTRREWEQLKVALVNMQHVQNSDQISCDDALRLLSTYVEDEKE